MRLEVYVVTDAALSRGRSHEQVVTEAIQGGADVIQLREKHASSRELVEIGRRLRDLTREAGVLLIVNDRVDVALAVDADGVHVGQDDMPADVVRRLIGPDKLLGVSAATPEEARKAKADGADYLGVGAIYATNSKADAGTPTGPARLDVDQVRPSICPGGDRRREYPQCGRGRRLWRRWRGRHLRRCQRAGHPPGHAVPEGGSRRGQVQASGLTLRRSGGLSCRGAEDGSGRLAAAPALAAHGRHCGARGGGRGSCRCARSRHRSSC